MTKHPLKAFFRRGQPVPLTGADFAYRHRCAMQDRIDTIAALHRDGMIHQTQGQRETIWELTDAGIQYARTVLCIGDAKA